MSMISFLKRIAGLKTSEDEMRETMAAFGIHPTTRKCFVEKAGREGCRHNSWDEIEPPNGKETFLPDGPGSWFATYSDWHKCGQCGEVHRQEVHALI